MKKLHVDNFVAEWGTVASNGDESDFSNVEISFAWIITGHKCIFSQSRFHFSRVTESEDNSYVRVYVYCDCDGWKTTGWDRRLVHLLNKNAFQYDAYRPLQQPSWECVCLGGVCQEGLFAQGGVCLGVYRRVYTPWTQRQTAPCEQNHRQV